MGGFSRGLEERFEREDWEGSVELFFRSGGMADEQIDELKAHEDWPSWVEKGRALIYDSAAIGDRTGARIPAEVLPDIACRTLTLAGSESGDSLIEVSRMLADQMVDAAFLLVGGADHEAGPELIAPPVREFLIG